MDRGAEEREKRGDRGGGERRENRVDRGGEGRRDGQRAIRLPHS